MAAVVSAACAICWAGGRWLGAPPGKMLAGLIASATMFMVAVLANSGAAWAVLAPVHPLTGPWRAMAWVAAFPLMLTASFMLAVIPIRRRDWPRAYAALLAGPGLGGVLVACKLALPSTSPWSAFFAGAMAFPNDAATFLPAVAITGYFVQSPRPALRSWITAGTLCVGVAFLGATWLSGATSLSGLVAGLGLGTMWSLTIWLGHGLYTQAAGGNVLRAAWQATTTAVTRIWRHQAAWLAGILMLGIMLRVVSFWTSPLAVDAYAYAAMGHEWLRQGAFIMPWGDLHTYASEPVASHHYPPLFPAYLAAFYAVLGFSAETTRVAVIVSSLGAMLVVYACTRNLYGKGKALTVTAFVAISPMLVQNTGHGYSENLVLALFAATLWAILRSLERPWFIVLAGLLAGLGYLAKSSLGPFFIVAGLAGLAWRLRWRGWKVLRDPAYLTAIACFVAILATWSLRNWLLFGAWQTSAHLQAAYAHALAHPAPWLALSLVTFVFYATAGYLVLLGLGPWLWRVMDIPKLESEHDSGLWLALGLPLILTSLIDSALWLLEGEFFLNNVRYISFVLVPLAWLLVRHADPSERKVQTAAVVSVLLLASASIYFDKPTRAHDQEFANELAAQFLDGDTLGFVDANNHYAYRYYFALTQDGTRQLNVTLTCLSKPDCPPEIPRPASLTTTWVVAPFSAATSLPSDYTQVPTKSLTGSPQWVEGPTLWRRA